MVNEIAQTALVISYVKLLPGKCDIFCLKT